jgi:two-component system cell cycle response regulator
LQRQVKKLAENAEQNQHILSRFQEFELKLLACHSLSEVLDLLLNQSKDFFGLDGASLVLFDPLRQIHELVEEADSSSYPGTLGFRAEKQAFEIFYPQERTVRVGPLEPATADDLFAGAGRIQSAAMLPLIRNGEFIGSFHLGSVDPERFGPKQDVTFISHLASVIAVCLDSKVAHENLRHMNCIDMLTKVGNRHAFDRDFAEELSRASRTGDSLALLFLDLDDFKGVNDTHGHQAGDRALRVVGKQINQLLRKTDRVARYGGEEFVVLLPACEVEKAMEIADHIRVCVESLSIPDGQGEPFQLTLSIGVSTWKTNSNASVDTQKQGEHLLACADRALYQAKSQGRNCVCYQPFIGTVQNFQTGA